MPKLLQGPFWLDAGDPHRMRSAMQLLTRPRAFPLDLRHRKVAQEVDVWPKAVHRVVAEGISPEQAVEVSGAAVYTLSELASHEEPPRLASKEECADSPAGIDGSNQEDIVPEMLIDLAQRDAESTALAELLVQELNRATKMVKRRPAQEGFVVLESLEMPSLLIKLGCLSNSADEKALADDAHIARLASAVARAVDVYFGVGPS